MRPLYLFDDGLPLAPLTDFRPVFDVRTGALSMLERTQMSWGRPVTGVIVPDDIAALTRILHPGIAVNQPGDPDAEAILLNGRWVDSGAAAELTDLDPRTAVMSPDMTLLAACGPARDFARLVREGPDAYTKVDWNSGTPRLLSRPWHVKSFRDHALAGDLELLLAAHRRAAPARPAPGKPHANGAGDGIFIHESAVVHASAIIEADSGPVIIDEHAIVRPGAIILGPTCIGPHSTILERATIRGSTAIGPWCKVAGEVVGSIFQGFSNKAHDGFLGDSYIGEWVNLGAGTTNSNLLNTYGPVTARAIPGSHHEHTGEQFLGAIIGDHVKTAICTRIMTGAVIHTGAMLAQTAAVHGCIPPFAWMTDDGVHIYRFEKFIETARTMMSRRRITPGKAYLERLTALAHAAAIAARGP